MKPIATMLCAAVLMVNRTPAQTSTGPNDLVQQARKLNNEGRQDQALALYRKVLETSPDSFDAQMGSGIALDLKGEYAEARRHFSKAVETATPEAKPQALRSMAVSYAFEHNCKEAAHYETQVIDSRLASRDFAGAAEIDNEIGRICLESGDLESASKFYAAGHDAALRKAGLTSAEKDLWEFRWEHAQARLAARAGKADDARKHLAVATAILQKGTNPEQARFLPYLAGYVAFYRGDYKEALTALEKADPPDPFILSLLAQAFEKTGETSQAMENYRKILTFNMHNPANALARPLARRKVSGSN